MRLALIDVDGTLLADTRSEPRFAAYLAAHGLIRPRQLAAFVAFGLRWSPQFGRATWKRDKAYLAGLEVGRVQALAARYVHDVLIPRLRPAMRQRIEHHRSRDDELALLSGTPEFIAAPLAEHLGITRYRATICATRDGRFTADPPLAHPYGRAKIECAEALCEQIGVTLEDCIAYADSIHDRHLLGRVGHPVAVHPDGRLARLATQRGWESLAGA